MSQQETDNIHNEIIEELKLADEIIEKLDVLRKEKNKYDYLFDNARVAVKKDRITKSIQPREHAKDRSSFR